MAGVARGMNDKQAMVAAGFAPTTKPYTILRRPNVAAAVAEAQAEIRETALFDAHTAMAQLDADIAAIQADKNPNRMALAKNREMQMRLAGLWVERLQIEEKTDLADTLAHARARTVDDVDVLLRQLEGVAAAGRLSSEHYDRIAKLLPTDAAYTMLPVPADDPFA